MDKSVVLKNHLQGILLKEGMTQKELANLTSEREAAISDFIKLKRSTLNIELILKVATVLGIENIEELVSLEPTFKVEGVVQNKWYTLSTSKKVRFSYSHESNEETFKMAEVLDSGIIMQSEYSLTDKSMKEINELFKELKIELNTNAKESESVLKLIEICRYRGDVTETLRYQSDEEAIEVFELLF